MQCTITIVRASELENTNFSSKFNVVYVLLLVHRIVWWLAHEMTKQMYEIPTGSVKLHISVVTYTQFLDQLCYTMKIFMWREIMLEIAVLALVYTLR
jgi:hypothetical protein